MSVRTDIFYLFFSIYAVPATNTPRRYLRASCTRLWSNQGFTCLLLSQTHSLARRRRRRNLERNVILKLKPIIETACFGFVAIVKKRGEKERQIRWKTRRRETERKKCVRARKSPSSSASSPPPSPSASCAAGATTRRPPGFQENLQNDLVPH